MTTERYLTEMFAYLDFEDDHELRTIADGILAKYGIADDIEILDDDLLEMAAGGISADCLIDPSEDE